MNDRLKIEKIIFRKERSSAEKIKSNDLFMKSLAEGNADTEEPKMAFTKDLDEHHFDSTNLRKLGDMIGKALSGEEHYAVIHWRGMEIKRTEPEYPDAFMDTFYGEYTITMEVHVYEKDEEGESSEDL